MQILNGHVLEMLREIPNESVHCVVTSPPYWALRNYATDPQVWGGDAGCAHEWGVTISNGREAHNGIGKSTLRGGNVSQKEAWMGGTNGGRPDTHACIHCGAWRGELGQEPSVDLFVSHLAEIFREVHRVLRADGTLWLNLGDSYANQKTGDTYSGFNDRYSGRKTDGGKQAKTFRNTSIGKMDFGNLKPKDLCGIPWRVAFALQADGWYLRSDIIWAKPNAMPESVKDRPTKSHEYLFLLTKSAKYYYDAEAIKELSIDPESHNGC